LNTKHNIKRNTQILVYKFYNLLEWMFIDNLYIAVRKEEVEKIREKFPDRIPIIVEKAKTSKLPDIDKTK
jgi:hypothetical protein